MQLNGKWLQNWPVQVGTGLYLNCKTRTSQDCSLDRLFKKLIPQTFLMGNSSQEPSPLELHAINNLTFDIIQL